VAVIVLLSNTLVFIMFITDNVQEWCKLFLGGLSNLFECTCYFLIAKNPGGSEIRKWIQMVAKSNQQSNSRSVANPPKNLIKIHPLLSDLMYKPWGMRALVDSCFHGGFSALLFLLFSPFISFLLPDCCMWLFTGVTMTLSTQVEGKSFNQGGHKFGIGLDFEA